MLGWIIKVKRSTKNKNNLVTALPAILNALI